MRFEKLFPIVTSSLLRTKKVRLLIKSSGFRLFYHKPVISLKILTREEKSCQPLAVAYAENFHGGWFIQWHRVVICIWCALFVTSQFDVILFPNQRFGALLT